MRVLPAIKDLLGQVFNWKKHPASVFFLAIPLALLGFGLVGLKAVLMLAWYGDPWYLVIVAVGLGLLLLGLWPIRKELFRAIGSKP